jgi:hypothetical protein
MQPTGGVKAFYGSSLVHLLARLQHADLSVAVSCRENAARCNFGPDGGLEPAWPPLTCGWAVYRAVYYCSRVLLSMVCEPATFPGSKKAEEKGARYLPPEAPAERWRVTWRRLEKNSWSENEGSLRAAKAGAVKGRARLYHFTKWPRVKKGRLGSRFYFRAFPYAHQSCNHAYWRTSVICGILRLSALRAR